MTIDLTPTQTALAAKCLFVAFGAVDHPDWSGAPTIDRIMVSKLAARLASRGRVALAAGEARVLAHAVTQTEAKLGAEEFQTVTGFEMWDAAALRRVLVGGRTNTPRIE